MTTQTAEINVTLEIDNIYDGDTIQTTVQTSLPPPPSLDHDSEEYSDWEYDYIFTHTGTGRTSGDSGYFVTVTASDRPGDAPPARAWVFGGPAVAAAVTSPGLLSAGRASPP